MQITDLQMVHKELNTSYIPQYIVVVNIKMSKCGIEGKCSQKHNTHYLRIKCVLQAHHENNAYCVRIKGVFGICASDITVKLLRAWVPEIIAGQAISLRRKASK